MCIDTLLRRAEHAALQEVELSGRVLDLGGDFHSEYHRLIKGSPQYTTLNLDPKTKPDIFHNLEEPLPIESDSYDHVLLINVLEHIYNYRQLLTEAFRVVRPGGSVVIVVPFLFPVHPSPDDFWRFSANALRREVEAVGGHIHSLMPLGSGVFAARYVMLDRLMPFPLRALASVTIRPLVPLLDAAFFWLARVLRKKYHPSEYALGFCVHASV